MKPRRTVDSTGVLTLPGGTEDNDLWFESARTEIGTHVYETVWEPTIEERNQIALGANIRLNVYGRQHPPVSVGITTIELGRGSK